MELNAVSAAGVSSGELGSKSSAHAELKLVARSEAPRETEKSRESHGEHRRHDHPHHYRGQRGRALQIFKQELKVALSASFRTNLAVEQPAYAGAKEADRPDDVATDTVGAAKRIVAEIPVEGSRSLVKLRQLVEQSVSVAREAAGSDDDFAEVEGAAATVNKELDSLENEAGKNVESTASVLKVDTRSRQRSTINIRTQEGDIVKLKLKQSSSLSASDVSASNGSNSASSTEIEVSSRSRLLLRVEGDLNEAESEAIRNVFAQAEAIADEFFGGDLLAAFDLASAFEYDTEQLARVDLRFRSRQVSRVSYAEVNRVETRDTDTDDSVPAIARDSEKSVSAPAAPPPTVVKPDDPVKTTVSAEQPPRRDVKVDSAEVTDIAEPAPAAVGESPFLEFFGLLSNFLQSVTEGFEASSNGGGSLKFHYSESFKLEILKSVIEFGATDESADAANLAASLIDGVAAASEQQQED